MPLSIGIGAGRVFAESTIVANRRLQGAPRRAGRPVRAGRRVARPTPGTGAAWPPSRRAAGDSTTARATLDQLRDERFPIREIHPWSVAVTELAEAAEVVGDRAVATHVLAVASPYSGRLAVSGPSANRPFDQALAQAALTVGDPSAAAAYATRAVAASRHRRTPVFLVRELVFLAEARGAVLDTEIRPLVTEARELAERMGTMVAVDDIERYGLPS